MTQKADNFSRENKLDSLANEVFKIRPILGETYARFKDLSLLEFTQRQSTELPNANVLKERRNEVIGVISEYAKGILGEDVAKSISEQLAEKYAVITSDHHGPITHPDFVNSNLLNSFVLQKSNSEKVKNLIVLSFSNVSLNNFSFPRGHLLHSFKNGEVKLNELPFSPSKDRQCPVFNYPPFIKDSLINVKSRVNIWKEEGVINDGDVQEIDKLIDEIYAQPSVLNLKSYSEQITMTNYHLWKRLFVSEEVKPNLLYLEIESIVAELLNKFHVHGNTIISKLLFDDRYNQMILKYFDGITAAFSSREKSGTFLFWAIPKNQKYRVSLWKKGDSLVSFDGSYSVDLKPEAIGQAIKEKELIPSTLLSFILLSFYYGLVLVGGGGQTSYLTKMKNAYLALLREVGSEEEQELVDNIPTDRLSFPYPSIAYLKGGDDIMIPSTMLDLFIYGGAGSLEIIRKMAETITFGQGLLREMSGLYRMLVAEEEQDSSLLSISTREIDEMTGFSNAMKTFATLEAN